MDIVDAQIHLFMTMDDDEAVRVMDSLGIRSALIDEAWDFGDNDPSKTTGGAGGELMPSWPVGGGVHRPVAPGAIAASMRRPDRFGYFLRINARDPDLDFVMRSVAASPGGRGFRLDVRAPDDLAAYEEGHHDAPFRIAERLGLPMFLFSVGRAPAFERYIRAHPSLPIIFDHCGLPQSAGDFDRLLDLARYPNTYLKWSHAPLMFHASRFPFPEVRPHLARALDAFGRERIMWASDFTAIDFAARVHGRPESTYSWAEALYYMRCNPELSEDDQEWVLGRTARTVLNWAG